MGNPHEADVGLNDPQARAVAHVEGPLLVFAGAGSGKTRVITYRVANLVATHDVAPYRILAVTFTNKAAGEMRARLSGLLGDAIVRDLWVGTFHATCARLLRRYHDAVGLSKDFVIYDDADQKAVVGRVLKELSLDDRRYAPRALLSRIRQEKQEGRGPNEVELRSYFDDRLAEIYAKYEAHLRACNAVDFEDLIYLATKLAESDEPAGHELRRRFSHVLVDEFQDTNHIQYRLVRQLVAAHQNLCVVGDDDQSIYSWRGADIRNIRGFREDFPAAEVIKLEQNYRSSGRIVRAALSVIAESREREPKNLWTENPVGEPIKLVSVRDERDEAAYVVSRLRALLRDGTRADDVAIFYRIHAQSRVLEEAMRAEKIPYAIIGGMKFFERAEVKDVLAYLRVLANPRSDVDLLRVINVPARGIGATTVDRLVSLASHRGTSVFDALALVDHAGEIAPAAKKKLHAFRALLLSLQKRAQDVTPSQLAELLLDETGYRKVLRDEDTAEADARLENLAELVGSIAEYEEEADAGGQAPSLSGFLERVSLASDLDASFDEPKVPMMTVHGAKGLEFSAVFLTGMEEDVFPYRGMSNDDGEDIEEERRLAYVAITRARKHLSITHATTRTLFGQLRYGRPSQFLRHLPEADVEVVVHGAPREARYAPSVAPMPPIAARPFMHPQAPPKRAPERAPGERYVETDPDAHAPSAGHDDGEGVELRRGSRVRHQRFGEGEVRSVEHAGELVVVAFFPGWGEKKILARFLST